MEKVSGTVHHCESDLSISKSRVHKSVSQSVNMANYQEIFFLGTQPSVNPPNRPKKVKTNKTATNKTADPTDIQIVIMGLIHLDIKRVK